MDLDLERRLQQQLSEQVEQNNRLLQDLNDTEHEANNLRSLLADTEMELRGARGAHEAVLHQLDDAERSNQDLQNAVERVNGELQAVRLEASNYKTEADGLRKFVEDTRSEARTLKDENERLLQEIEALTKELERERGKVDRDRREETQRAEKHRIAYEQQSKELAQFRSEAAQAAADMQTRKTELEELMRRCERAEKEAALQRENAESLSGRMNQLESETRRANSLEVQIKTDLENEQLRAQRVESQVARARDEADMRERELLALQKKHDVMLEERRNTEAEARALKGELNTVTAELVDLQKTNEIERQRQERRIIDLQQQLDELRGNASKAEQALGDELRRQKDDRSRGLGEAEIRYAKLQSEYDELNDLLQRQRNEAVSREEVSRRERVELEDRLAATANTVKSLHDQLAQQDVASRKEVSGMLLDLQAVQRELRDRTAAHARSLGVVQSSLQLTTSAYRELQEEHGAVMAQLEALRNDAVTATESTSSLLSQWHHQSRSAMLDLVDLYHKSVREAEDAHNAQLAFEVQRDESNHKLALAERRSADLEHEVQALAARLEDAERFASERMRNVEAENESAQNLQSELQEQVQRNSKLLEAANHRSRSLQLDNERLQKLVTDADENMRKRTAAVEQQLQEIEQRLREVTTQRDSAQADIRTMQARAGDLQDKMAKLKEDYRRLEVERREQLENNRKERDQHRNRVEMLNEQLGHYQRQNKLLNSRIAQGDETRRSMQDELARLRQMANDKYSLMVKDATSRAQTIAAAPPAAPSTESASAAKEAPAANGHAEDGK